MAFRTRSRSRAPFAFVTSIVSPIAAASVLFCVGCDEGPGPIPPIPPASMPTTAAAVDTSAPTVDPTIATAPRKRISLGAVPLSMEVPESWSLQPGATGRIVLRGRAPSGELDVLLGTGPMIRAAELPLMLKQAAKTSNNNHVRNEVVQRDNMAIVQSIAPQTPPGMAASIDPELVPMGWTVQVIVPDRGVDSSVYEITFLGLSQGMFDRDEQFLTQLVNSIKYKKPATQPAVP